MSLTRRSVLGMGFGAAAFGGLGHVPMRRDKERVLRVAHLTDLHLQPEANAPRWGKACVAHVVAQKPDLVLTGGDLVMDIFAAREARGTAQWAVFQDVMAGFGEIPVRHTIGNHDIWGWNQESSGTMGTEARWGKAWVQEELKMPGRYYAFEQAGWKFVVLDSVQRVEPKGYVGELDAEQMAWLKAELAKSPEMPVLVVSHIPFLSIVTFLYDGPKDGKWTVSGSDMVINAVDVKNVFRDAGNVKLALSGHIHMVDRVDFLGTSYICDGAVSGAWWFGKVQEFAPGYGLIDLYADGSFEHRYVNYGWSAG